MKRFILFVFCILWCGNALFSQQAAFSYEEQISALFSLQLTRYPQEKAYLHLDRTHYLAGDTVWFRGYVVHASSHVPDTVSRYLYVDLVNPADSTVRNLKIINRKGVYAGYIPLPEDMPGGNYTLWAHTMFMRNPGEDYFFRTPIRISDPMAAKIRAEASFTRSPGDKKLSVDIIFKNGFTENPVYPEELKVGLNRFEPRWTAEPDKSGLYRFTFRNIDTLRNHVLAVNYEGHSRYIEVPADTSRFDVTFHPEGGNVIAGDLNVIGFKALNPSGLSEEITGELFDAEGNPLTSFASFHKGMGSFSFYAAPGMRYYAVCTNKQRVSKRFELPEPREDAVGLRALKRNGRLLVSVIRPAEFRLDSLNIVIHTRGNVLYAMPIGEGKAPMNFDMDLFYSGVSHILLLDNRQNVLSERLVFVQNDDQAQVRFTGNDRAYGRRQRVKAGIRVTDPEGNPLKGSFSVSVTDDKDLLPDTARNIYTELLLASDLKGYIESPAWYFQEGNAEAARALDALMLTQGWRRYDIPKLMQGGWQNPEYPLEMGSLISGRVKAYFSDRSSMKTPVYMFVPAKAYFQFTDTDESGRFEFTGFEFPDSTDYFIQAISKRGNNRVEMILDQDLPTPKLSVIPGVGIPAISPSDRDFITKADQKWIMENGMRMIQMEAVSITASKQRKVFGKHSAYEGLADNVYDSAFLENWNIMQFEDLIPLIGGMTFDYDNNLILFRGNVPLFVIDDIPQPKDFEWDAFIDMSDVDRVEFIKGPQGMVFGSQGANGVFLIYTRRGAGVPVKNIPAFNRKLVRPLGYQKPLEFYSPKYETALERDRENISDLRTTLYWNANLQTDENGEAAFEFYTADGAATTYSVVIEGVSDDGRVVRKVEKIRRQ